LLERQIEIQTQQQQVKGERFIKKKERKVAGKISSSRENGGEEGGSQLGWELRNLYMAGRKRLKKAKGGVGEISLKNNKKKGEGSKTSSHFE